MGQDYCVYIMANEFRALYIGVTGDLTGRVSEHKQKLTPGFTSRYGLDKLVYYEVYGRPVPAIEREKQLKGWRRSRKATLIEGMNPTWEDLAKDWYWFPPGLQDCNAR